MKGLRLFGTSGIRGTANVEITPEMATRLGVTFASFLGNDGTVAVGRDVRLPAKLLHYALISGLLAGGINVEDCGLTPTPALLWAIKERGLDGVVAVTGSHTPPEIIGFLFFMSDTAELSVKESYEFEKVFFSKPKEVAWNEVGECSEVNVSDLYLRSVLRNVDLQKISSANFKVVVDPGNGAAAIIFDKILQAAGVKVIMINDELDGTFPYRDPYPRPEVLGALMKKISKSGADLGSATDADGDRAIFVDDKGKALWGDISGCIFARDILVKHGGGVIVTPINASQLFEHVCNKYDGKIAYTKVGAPCIVSEIKKVGAIFGVEETGKNIWPETILYSDSILSTLRMLEIIAKEQRTLSELVQDFPKFYMMKKTFHCPETLKEKVTLDALKEWRKRGEQTEIVTLDGVKITYPDGSWILLRPSGTEPVFRVYVESLDPTRAQELLGTASRLIKKFLS